MWAAHGVQAPIWGYCTDRTTHALEDVPFQRIKQLPAADRAGNCVRARQLAFTRYGRALAIECIDWVVLGYEIVRSIFPGWKFAATDTIAANALHGALLVGHRHAVAPRKRAWQQELAAFRVELYCNEALRSTGAGALVLGSPLIALRYLVELLLIRTTRRSAQVKSFRPGR